LQLRVATGEEVDGDGAPDRGGEREQELAASCGDRLRTDSEVIGPHEVESKVLEGWVSAELPRAREGADENWVWY